MKRSAAHDDRRRIRDMKRGEIGYVTSWTRDGDMTAHVSSEPSGTLDTRIRRTKRGFEFVDNEKRNQQYREKLRDRRLFATVMVVMLLLLFVLIGGGLAIRLLGGAWEIVGAIVGGLGGCLLAVLLAMGFWGP